MSFQVLLQADNRMYVGFGPFSPEDEVAMLPDYVVFVIDDDAKYDWLLEQVLWPPYAHLGEDGQTFDLVGEWPG
jgi:hypothetical protein